MCEKALVRTARELGIGQGLAIGLGIGIKLHFWLWRPLAIAN